VPDLRSGGVHVDHIHPVLFGGIDDLSNLQAFCANCTLSKGANPAAAA
jgi:5-methylcytosine-specific restriction endonuclease McrA